MRLYHWNEVKLLFISFLLLDHLILRIGSCIILIHMSVDVTLEYLAQAYMLAHNTPCTQCDSAVFIELLLDVPMKHAESQFCMSNFE